MTGKRHPWLILSCLLAAHSAGCGSPATFTVATVIHPDGSCDRTIDQPRGEFLPAEAFRPEWIARWKSVTDTSGPPESRRSGGSAGKEKYFTAHGSFRGPDEIPPHYRHANMESPGAGASELRRSYRRSDHGFIVEHRWSEKVTNIVTLAGFLAARDKLLDLLLPFLIERIEKELGREVRRLRAVRLHPQGYSERPGGGQPHPV